MTKEEIAALKERYRRFLEDLPEEQLAEEKARLDEQRAELFAKLELVDAALFALMDSEAAQEKRIGDIRIERGFSTSRTTWDEQEFVRRCRRYFTTEEWAKCYVVEDVPATKKVTIKTQSVMAIAKRQGESVLAIVDGCRTKAESGPYVRSSRIQEKDELL